MTGASDLDALRSGRKVGAQRLDLSGCGLAEVPREIFDHADTLEYLDLSGNMLGTLPADMGRLSKLRALFCSGNPFDRLPSILGDCTALSQVGFRGCGLRDVPPESLPPTLRWLTLTDNRIESLPAALGQRPALQKLMLAGNRLDRLPESLADAQSLELLRLSANRFDAIPPWLLEMPRLAWLAWAGNPAEERISATPAAAVSWSDLQLGALLGEGASGRIFQATWRAGGEDIGREPVALKLFKGAMTSDGLPECEMAACLAAAGHPHLVAALGYVIDHPEGAAALLMPLLPSSWRVLAGAPSAASCSRDVYDPALRFDREVAIRIARCIGSAAAHMHGRGLLHGDLYGHNTLWDGDAGAAVLSDFGAASFLPERDAGTMERLDVLAWGILLGELLERCHDGAPDHVPLRDLQRACLSPLPAARPIMREALDILDRFA